MYLYVKGDSRSHGFKPCTVKNTVAGALESIDCDSPMVLHGVYDLFGELVPVKTIRMCISQITKGKDYRFVTKSKDNHLVICKAFL